MKPLIFIYDSDLVRVGAIQDYENFTYVRDWYSVDTWTMKINRWKSGVDLLEPLGFISFTAYGGDHLFGLIETIESPLKEGKGSEQWTITGRGIKAVLGWRKTIEGWASGTGFDIQTAVTAEAAMRHYVDQNVITCPSDGNRAMAGIALVADGGRGGTVSETTRAENLLDVLERLSKASGLNCDLIWTGSGKNFEFTISAGTDRSATVALSSEFGQILNYNFTLDILNYRNVIYVAGEGTGAARILLEHYAGAEPTGWNRIEDYLDASECTTTALRQERGNAELTAKGEDASLTFTLNPWIDDLVSGPGRIRYGTDYFLGDTITVVWPGIITLASRLITMTEDYSEGGKTITPGLGRTRPDLSWVIVDLKRKTSSAGRK